MVTPECSKREPIPIEPEEWDFRPIGEAELETAIEYEYSRECDWLRSAVGGWHEQEVPEWEVNNDSTDGHILVGKTQKVGDILKKDFDSFPWSIQQILYFTMPPSTVIPGWFVPIALLFPEFPRPWLTIDAQSRLKRAKIIGQANRNRLLPAFASVGFESMGRLNLRETQAERLRQGYGYYLVFVDWWSEDSQIKKGMASWLVKNRPEDIKQVTKKGKATSKPFERLKWLSALRFQEHGFNYNDAQQHIKQREKLAKMTDLEDILPRYSSDAAWCRAARNARLHLWQNFQNSMTGTPAPRPVKSRKPKGE